MGFLKGVGNTVGGIFQNAGDAMTVQNQYRAVMPEEVMSGQRSLADALRLQAEGRGPDPSAAAFQQNLDQVAAQQAGAIASQKGISPALQARMIADQAAKVQLGGAAQAAQMNAQQQLNARNLQLQLYSQMGNQALGVQNINAGITGANAAAVNKTTQGIMGGAAQAGMMAATGGAGAPAMAMGGYVMEGGGVVPGRAAVPGDSPKNDTVLAMLSPGEVVVPRSLVEDPERAKRFIEELTKSTGKSGYGRVLEAKRKAKNG